jgi:GTP1/Obg family GTP-binding protein
MAHQYNFKSIPPVPMGTDILDIVLTRTQRKTPTVVHAGWKIVRIRAFYMRKVGGQPRWVGGQPRWVARLASEWPSTNVWPGLPHSLVSV